MKQPSPKPGTAPVAPCVLGTLENAARQHVDYVGLWPWLEQRLKERIEAGRQKYGTVLQTHNGRDALEDAWQEAADLVQYLTQEWMEGNTAGIGFIIADARQLLLRLSREIWEREHFDLDNYRKPERVDGQVVYGPSKQVTTEIDEWAGWQEPAKQPLIHDSREWRGDWCECEACQQAARRGFQRRSEPE